MTKILIHTIYGYTCTDKPVFKYNYCIHVLMYMYMYLSMGNEIVLFLTTNHHTACK